VVTSIGLGVRPRCDRKRLHYQVRGEARQARSFSRHGVIGPSGVPGANVWSIFARNRLPGRTPSTPRPCAIFCARVTPFGAGSPVTSGLRNRSEPDRPQLARALFVRATANDAGITAHRRVTSSRQNLGLEFKGGDDVVGYRCLHTFTVVDDTSITSPVLIS